MKVSNQKCIRRLSFRFLRANRRRNRIAVFAIALTTLLFTSLFTIVLSLNSSYETYQFRQLGGYAHGTFKDVSPEQAEQSQNSARSGGIFMSGRDVHRLGRHRFAQKIRRSFVETANIVLVLFCLIDPTCRTGR